MKRIEENNKKTPLAEKIREARIARGYTLTELAEKIGVSRQSVTKYETGLSVPSPSIFNNIVQVLGFPLAFFFTEDYISTKYEGPIYFRSLKSADRRNRDISEIRAIWMNRVYTFVKTYVGFPELNLPDLDDSLIMDKYSFEDINKIAYLLRDYWNVGKGPIDNLIFVLEKNGLIVTQIPINDTKIDAFSRWIGDKPIIFLGSDKKCAVKSRFDLAHELGHAILHRHHHPSVLQDSKCLKAIEKEANTFASAFLLPEDSFGSEVMSTTLEHFIMLKQRWKVSIQAMVYRCNVLGYLTDDQTLYIRKKMAKLNMRKNEPLDDELVPEKSVVLRQAIEMLLENKVLTKRDIRETFNLPVNELEELLTLPPGTLSEKAQVINLKFK